jgi:magnesium transporter
VVDSPDLAPDLARWRREGLINAIVYRSGEKIGDIYPEDAGQWSQCESHVVWIGLYQPSAALLDLIGQQFSLHPLMIEDALSTHELPKIEEYDQSLFLAARTAQMGDRRIEFGETYLLVGPGYVVTIRHGASTSYAAVRARAEARPANLAEGEDYIVYIILDFIVDNYFPVLDRLSAEVDQIEDDILSTSISAEEISHLYVLRRDLLRLRNAVAPLEDVCRWLERNNIMVIDKKMRPHFRDLRDHLRRVSEQIDTLRETLAFAFEARHLTAQMQQTDISRRLAAWAGILAVPTAIAGVYGMNFEHMPELKWEYGYFAIITLISVICIWLYMRFRRAGWL